MLNHSALSTHTPNVEVFFSFGAELNLRIIFELRVT